MNNSICIIRPYDYFGTWVFDDEKVGLVREPFVCGTPEIINHFTKHLPNAKNGFTVLFSAGEMPEYDVALERENEMAGGCWYKVPIIGKSGWLCPALFKYFDAPPEKIYIKIKE